MRMRRYLSVRASIVVIAALGVALVATACGSASSSGTKTGGAASGKPASTKASGTATGKSVRLGVFMASSANSYFAANLQGIHDAAGAAGNVAVTEFGADFDATTQANQLRDALASRRFNAWLVAPVDGGSITPEIRQAVSDGIAVGCILTPCGPNVASQTIQVPGVVVRA